MLAPPGMPNTTSTPSRSRALRTPAAPFLLIPSPPPSPPPPPAGGLGGPRRPLSPPPPPPPHRALPRRPPVARPRSAPPHLRLEAVGKVAARALELPRGPVAPPHLQHVGDVLLGDVETAT